jgi:hypothetical protein
LEKGKTGVSLGNEPLLPPTASGRLGLAKWGDTVPSNKNFSFADEKMKFKIGKTGSLYLYNLEVK